MKEMADVANPVLMKMGLDKEAITGDIEEFVKILGDNREEEYFASVNIDAKYSKNRYTLSNLQNWLQRLEDSITKILDFMDSESEKSELEGLFKIIDSSRLTKAEKETLKNEFTTVLNRIKCR
jgi:hypothetical protein